LAQDGFPGAIYYRAVVDKSRAKDIMTHRKTAVITVVMLLMAILALPVGVHAESGEIPDGRSTGPCMGEEGFSRAWLDRTHVYINRILCQPSVWFDNFFGEQSVGDEWPGSLVRWKHSFRLDEKEGGIYRSEFNASLRLPKASRFKLIVTSGSRENESDVLPDSDPYGFEAPGENESERQAAAGFRFLLAQTRRIKANIGFGLRLDTPLDPYVRLRLRLTQPLGTSSLIRITPSAILYRDEGLSRYLRLDLEKRVGENILLRASQSGRWKEGRPGIRWGTELTFLERLSPKTVLSINAGAKGESQPFVYTERYRLSLRVRRNVYRPWFFVELEPELYWPRDEEGDYRKYHAFTFRIELQFFS